MKEVTRKFLESKRLEVSNETTV